MLRKLFASFSLVGLDIQPDAIRIIYFKKWRKKRYLVKAIAEKLPASFLGDDKTMNWPELAAVLQKVVATHQLQGCPTAICLPMNKVQLQKITVPCAFTYHDIEEAIKLQIERDLPGMTETLSVDFIELSSAELETKTILSVVAKEAYLSQYIKSVNEAGLKVCVVDIEIYAWHRILSSYLSVNHTCIAVLYESSMVKLMVFNQKDILFYDADEIVIEELVEITTQKLKVCGIDFSELTHLILCDVQSVKLNWSSMFNLIPTLRICEFSWVTLFSHSDNQQAFADANAFMLASGLALREVPVWS